MTNRAPILLILLLLSASATRAEAPATLEGSLAVRDLLAEATEASIEQAVDRANELVEAHAGSAEAHYWHGAAHGMMAGRSNMFSAAGHARKVKAAFERALELDPRHVEALLGLMQFHLQAPGFMGGDEDVARQLVTRLEAIDAVSGHRGRAMLKLVAKDQAGAEAEWVAALKIEPAHPDVLMAVVARYSRDGRHDALKPLLDAALAHAPEDVRVRYQMGRWSALSGKELEAGLAQLDALAAMSPPPKQISLAGLHWRRGQILAHLKRHPEALASVQRAAALEPESKDIRATLESLQKG